MVLPTNRHQLLMVLPENHHLLLMVLLENCHPLIALWHSPLPSPSLHLPANESPEELLSSTVKASSPVPHSSTVKKHQSDITTTAPTNKSGPNPSTAKGSIAPTNIASGSKHQVQDVSPAHHIALITQCIRQILPLPAAPRTKPSEVASADKSTTGPHPAAP